MTRPSRSRIRTALVAATLAIVALAPSAMADTVYWSSGKIGHFDVVDTTQKPGATCSSTVYGIGIEAREPKVFARDRTGGEDRQKVGWQVIVQRKQPGVGWKDLLYSPILTAQATDKTPADFPGTQKFGSAVGSYRVVDVLMWYGADGTTIKGAADARVTYYRQTIGSTSVTAIDHCAA